MKLNYTTNFQFRALYSIATPTLPLQASPTMYQGSICFCINISYPLTHRKTNSHIHGYTVHYTVYIRHKKHVETFCVCNYSCLLVSQFWHVHWCNLFMFVSSKVWRQCCEICPAFFKSSRGMSSRLWLCMPESMILSLLDPFRTDRWTEVIWSKWCLAVPWPLLNTCETVVHSGMMLQISPSPVCLFAGFKERLTYIDTEWLDLSRTTELVFVWSSVFREWELGRNEAFVELAERSEGSLWSH